MNFRIIVVTLCFVTALSGCGGDEYFTTEETDQQQDRMSAAVYEAARTSAYPLTVTQAEFQVTEDRETWWVTQFEDPATSEFAQGGAPPRFDYVFAFDVVKEALTEYSALRQNVEVETYIFAFKDFEETVFEVDADDMYRYVDGALTSDELAEAARISQLN